MVEDAARRRFRGQLNRVPFLVSTCTLDAAVAALTFRRNAIFAVRIGAAAFRYGGRTEGGIRVGADILREYFRNTVNIVCLSAMVQLIAGLSAEEVRG